MTQEDEILTWNMRVVERHDRDIEILKDHCSSMLAELKVIKMFSSIILAIIGLTGSVTLIIKLLGSVR